ncbi:hypothetical protein GQ53DRAFT_596282, partial [Thozetella sp. PMI_491]
VVKGFKWSCPFPADGSHPMGFEVKCEAKASFFAKQFQLKELQHPSPWAMAVETFVSWHPYAGSWNGEDLGDSNRVYIMVEYKDVPPAVRDWIDATHSDPDTSKDSWWQYAIIDKPNRDTGADAAIANPHHEVPDEERVLFFAAAALYETAPLWVAKGSKCEDEMLNLSKYHPDARDEAVIAWPYPGETYTPDFTRIRQHIKFDIKAQQLSETEHTRSWREMWEKFHRDEQRQQRREEREKRQATRDGVQREKDEL